MNLSHRWKQSVAAMVGGALALQPMIAGAALHQLSFVTTNSPTLQTIDLVANSDFDFDAVPPSQTAQGTLMNRAYLQAVFDSMAQFLFTMTEGRHRIGTVYVYRNERFSSNVDVRIMGLAPGRSNGRIAGFGKRGGTTINYVARSATIERGPDVLGKVVAHEHGHYIYGLFDEYREAGIDRTTVLVIDTDPLISTDAGGHWWDVAVPEVSVRPQVNAARREYEAALKGQRL